MQQNQISWDPETGSLTQSGIRYVLMRPDVVMGAASHLPEPEHFVAAISESAFVNAQDSFMRYRESGQQNGDAVEHGCAMAAQLGWGRWQVIEKHKRGYTVSVLNSPFAIPAPGRDMVMCGWITGVLRAIAATDGSAGADVSETSCAAQGHDCCTFEVRYQED